MSLVSLAFATILISPTDIPVPPLPAFSVGHFSKSTFKITVNQPGKDKPMVIPGKMERKDVRSEEKGVRVVTITLDVPEILCLFVKLFVNKWRLLFVDFPCDSEQFSG